jgi:hypothetical protein
MEKTLELQIAIALLSTIINFLADVKKLSLEDDTLTFKKYFTFTRRLRWIIHILVIVMSFLLIPFADQAIKYFFPTYSFLNESDILFILIISSRGYEVYKVVEVRLAKLFKGKLKNKV